MIDKTARKKLENEKGLVPIGRAAEVLGVSVDTLRRWNKKGLLTTLRPDKKDRYFRLADLEGFKKHKKTMALTAARGVMSEVEEDISSEVGKRQKNNWESMEWVGNSVADVKQDQLRLSGIARIAKITFILPVVLVLLVILLITLFFQFWPKQAIKFFGFQAKANINAQLLSSEPQDSRVLAAATSQQASGGNPLSLPAAVSVEILRLLGNSDAKQILLPDEQLAQLRSRLQVTTDNIFLSGDLVFPQATQLKIGSSELVANLNADFVRGKVPQDVVGDLAVIGSNGQISALRIGGENILPGTVVSGAIGNSAVTTEKLANGAVTKDKLDSSIGLSKIATIAAGTGLSGGGDSDKVTLSVDQGFSPTWTGTHTFTKSATVAGTLGVGTLNVAGFTIFNGVTYLFPTADGSSSQVLSTNGTGRLSWVAQSGGSGGGASQWQLNLGVISPFDVSQSLAIGGNSTAAAKLFIDGTTGTISTGIWQGTAIGALYGGTGQSAVATGDLLYGSATNTWSRLADIATGNVLLSGGVTTAPSWGKVVLGTHTTGNYVSSLTGTTNQVNVSASTGDVTLSLPQSIGTASTPTFAGLNIGTNLTIDANGFLSNPSASSGLINVVGSLGINDIMTIAATSSSYPGLYISANTPGKAGLLIDQISSSGDIFAASLSGANKFVITSVGNVGINTSAPGYKLEIHDSQAATAAALIYNTNTGTDADGLIIRLGFGGVNTGGNGNRFIAFETGNGTTYDSLAGSITSGGTGVTYNTNGVDFAEYYDADPSFVSQLTSGTVACQGASGLKPCTAGVGERIIGVISANPGFLGGSRAGSNRVIVGIIGQLPVRVSTNSPSIAKGDYLTVSPDGGQVRKAQGKGYTIGTALETWTSGGAATIQGFITISNSYFDGDTQFYGYFAPVAQYDWRGYSNAMTVASVSGATTAVAFTVDNSVGDLITASSSGLSRFVIKQGGNVGIGTGAPNYKLEVSGDINVNSGGVYRAGGSTGVTVGSAACVTTTGGIVTGSGSCPSGGGSSQWSLSSGVIYPLDTSQSLAVGGNSTSSAKILFNGVSGNAYFTAGANIASGSGSSPALVVNQNGNWDIFTASSNGTPKFVIKNDGNVGIGSNLPTVALDIVGALKTSTAITAGNGFTVSAGTVTLPSTSIANAALQGSGALTVTAGAGLSGGGSVALGASTTLSLDQSTALNLSGKVFFTNGVNVASNSGASPALTVNQNGAWDLFTASSNGTPKFVIRNDGNVGIGSNLPTVALDIVGALKTSTAITAGNGFTVSAGSVTLPSTSVANAALQGSGALTVTAGTGLSGGGSVALGASTSLTFNQAFAPTLTGIHYFTAGVNIASNSGNAPALTVSQNGAWDIFTASQNGTPKFTINNAGNVGIGSNLPTVALDIVGALKTSTAITAGNGFTVSAGSVTLPTTSVANAALQGSGALTVTAGTGLSGGGSVALGASTSLSLDQAVAANWSGKQFFTSGINIASNSGASPALTVNQNGAWDLFTASSNGTPKFVIRNDGNVGIGSMVPTVALDIVGALKTSTAITAGNGFTVSAGSVTLPATSIANAALQGSGALTVTAGTGLSGGGSVALGASTTLSLDQSVAAAWTGKQYFTSGVNVASNSGAAPALTVNQNGAWDLFTASSNGTPKFVIRNDGNVGIGSNVPTVALDIVGGLKTSTAITAGNGFTVSAGSVTLPTTSVANAALQGSGALTVTAGSGLSGGGSVALGASTSLSLNQAFSPTWTGLHYFSSGVNIASNSGAAPALTVNQNGTWDLFTASSNGTPKFVIKNDGNVGIGSVVPTVALDIVGALKTSTAITAGNGFAVSAGSVTLPATSIANAALQGSGALTVTAGTGLSGGGSVALGASTSLSVDQSFSPTWTGLHIFNGNVLLTKGVNIASNSGAAPALTVNQNGAWDLFTASSNGTPKFVIRNDGNVGIGTMVPGFNLEVVGTAKVSGNLTVGSCTGCGGGGGGASQWQLNSGVIAPFDVSQSVAIGATATSSAKILLNGVSGNAYFTAGLNVASNSGNAPALVVNQNGAWDLFTASSNGTPKFVIRNDGNVGIGSMVPTVALDIVGALKTSTAITAGNGFTVSAGTVTLPSTSVANAALQGSGALTVTAGTGLSGGGSVALGASTTLSLDQAVVPTWTGLHIFNGNVLLTKGENIASNSGSSPALTVNQNGTWDLFTASSNGTPKFVIRNDGNVGIGSNLPTVALDIIGALKTSTAITAGNGFTVSAGTVTLPATSIANAALQGSGALTVTAGTGLSGGGSVALGASTSLSLDQSLAAVWTGKQYFTSGVNIASNSGSSPALTVNQNGAWDLFTASSNGTPKFVIRNDGNVGIGSNLPTVALDVVGALKTSTAITAGNGFTVSAGSVTLPTTSVANAALQGSGALTVTAGTGLSGGGSVALGASTTLSLDQSLAAVWSGKQYFTSGVNVASNSGASPALTINQNGAWDILSASSNGTPKFVIRNDGNVGIGSNLPTVALDIVGALKTSTAITAGNGFTVSAGTVTLPSTSVANAALQGSGALTVTAGSGLSGGGSVALGGSTSLSVDQAFSPTWTGLHIFNGNVLLTKGENVASNSGSSPALTVNQNGAWDLFTASSNGTPKFVIRNDGNVGIGSNLPTVALDIVGALKTSTAITAGNGFTVSAGTVTLPATSIANAALQGSGALTVTAGTGLSGGGSVALGASTSLSVNQAFAPTWTGIQYFTGGVNIASNSGNAPALTVSQNGAWDLFTASSNGTPKFVIRNDGNVGIGSNLPTVALDVVGAGKVSTAFTVGNALTVSAGNISLTGTQSISATTNLTVDASGTLGVGTGTQTALTLGRAGATSAITSSDWSISTTGVMAGISGITSDGGYTQSGVNVNTFTGNNLVTLGENVASNSGSSPALTVNQNGAWDIFTASVTGTPKFVIKNNGNVGIGTMVPGFNLEVVGTAKVSGNLTVGSCTGCGAGGGGASQWQIDATNGLIAPFDTQQSLAIGSNASSSAKILLNGVSGNAWFTAGLSVASSSGATDALTVNQSGAGDIFTASQAGVTKFVILNNGNVGIGSAVPTVALDIVGALKASTAITAGNGFTVSAGSVTLPATSIANAALQGSGALTVTAGTGLSGGGSVALGASTSLSLNQAFAPTWTGIHYFTGGVNIASNSGNATGLTVSQNGAWDLFTASSNGTPKFVIRNDGNVGIGSNLPTVALDIVGALKTSTAITAGNGFTVSAGTVTLPTTSVANAALQGSGALTVTAGTGLSGGGSVALGASTSLTFNQAFAPTLTGIHYFTAGVNIASNSGNAPGLTVSQNGAWDIFTASSNGTPKFTINNAGNVGIGSNLPTVALDIVGAGKTSTAFTVGNALTVSAGNVSLTGTQSLSASTALTLGVGSATTAITSSDWAIDATGIMTGIGNITTNGGYTQSGTTLNTFSGVTSHTANALFTAGASIASSSGATDALTVNQSGAGDIFTASVGGVPKFVILNNGNVGIGSTVPTVVLDVVGAGKVSTAFTVGNALTVSAGNVSLTGTQSLSASTALTLGVGSATTAITSSDWAIDATGIMTGIGNITTNGGYTQSGTSMNTFTGNSWFSTGVNIASNSGSSPALTVNQNGAWDIFTASQNGTPKFVIANNGNVGIGTTVPGFNLAVAGTLNVTGAVSCGSGCSAGPWTRSAPNVSLANAGDQVGIGTSSPVGMLQISGAQAGKTLTNLNYTGTDQTILTASYGGVLRFALNGSGIAPVASISAATSNAAMIVDNTGVGDLFTASSSGLNRFVIKQSGNVGVGTTTPQELLNVNGNILLSGQNNASASAWTFTAPGGGQLAAADAANSIVGATASAVYKGKLFIATKKVSGAGVYRWDGGTTWTLVTKAGGAGTSSQAISGDTAGTIHGYAMAVFNGLLYIGSQTNSTAALYVSNNADTCSSASAIDCFHLVSTTKGTVGAATTVPEISDLAVYNGNLYVATGALNAAGVYRYLGGPDTNATFTLITAGVGKINGDTATADRFYLKSYGGRLWMGAVTGAAAATAKVGYYIGDAAVTTTTLANTTVGTFGGGTAAMDDVTSMEVFNGELYIAAWKSTVGGEVYKLNGVINAASGAAPFIRLNSAIGRLVTTNGVDPTANTGGAFKLKSYNGRLYVGSDTGAAGNQSALYVYDPTLVTDPFSIVNLAGSACSSNCGKGTFGAQTSVDAISLLTEYNGNLIVGTYDSGFASGVYSWNNVQNQSYALKFSADTTSSNSGTIVYMATSSANTNMNTNGGTFLFNSSVTTNASAFDYAEDYPTWDDTLSPGDMVTVDPRTKDYIKKGNGGGSYLGVVSERPGQRLAYDPLFIDSNTKTVPVALVGRVPVKVSTESGTIVAGDYLTGSKVPGIAMKATGAGQVIGQALEGFVGDGVGRVSVFVRTGYNVGTGAMALDMNSISPDISEKLAQIPQINIELIKIKQEMAAIGSRLTNVENLTAILAGLKNPDSSTAAATIDLTSLGVAIKTPKLTADQVFAGKISVGSDASSSAITFDALGNAHFAGLVTAGKIKADQIEGLEIITGQLSVLSSRLSEATSSSARLPDGQVLGASVSANLSNINSDWEQIMKQGGLATVSGDLRVKGSGLFEGIVNVLDTLTTRNIMVGDWADFLGSVIFRGDTNFIGRPTFNSDTAGFATIKKDADRVEIVFDKEYKDLPVVAANLSFEPVKNSDGSDDASASAELEKKVLLGNYNLIITNKTTKGFTIVLSKMATDDLSFSWTAVAVNKAKKFASK